MPLLTALAVREWFKGPEEKEEAPTTLPEWIYAMRVRLDTMRIFQRFDLWIQDASSGEARTRINRQKRTADYKLEFHRQDNQPARLPICSQLKEPLYSVFPKPNTIRLMALSPGSGNSIIECGMNIYALENLPSYEALSYTWGRGLFHQIVCNGQLISVQENLRSALQQLRHSSSVRLLWIDALCINQQDVPERNSQMLHMRAIYQKARSVVVWLGESSETSSVGFSLLRDIVRAASTETASNMQRPMKSEELTLKGLPERSSPKWRALRAIFWREWFMRVWVIQEVSVAQAVVVVCGPNECSWSDMRTAAKYILDHSLDAVTDVDPSLVLKLSGFCERGDSKRHLLQLLSEARNSYATDDRDKVYALLGLASDVDSLSLFPDYSKDVSEVYTMMVKSWIQRDGNLDILGAVENHRYRIKQGLPCWVPDWEVHVPSSPFSAHPDFASMRAAGDSKVTCVLSHDNKTLVSRGQVLDSLDYVGITFEEYIPMAGSICRGNFFDDGLGKMRPRQWERMARNLKTYPTDESIESVFIRTLIGRIKLEPNMSSDELHRCYNAWRRYWSVVQREHGKFIKFSHMELSTEDLARATYFMKAQQQAAYGRRFFTTRNGYMGLSPSLARIGDKVVILLGGKTPYILRKIGERGYRFVGECYVHGMMAGEGLGQSKDMQDFQIW